MSVVLRPSKSPIYRSRNYALVSVAGIVAFLRSSFPGTPCPASHSNVISAKWALRALRKPHGGSMWLTHQTTGPAQKAAQAGGFKLKAAP